MRPFSRRARVAAPLLVAALVAASCAGQQAAPTLEDTRGAGETAAALEVLVEADAIEPVPTAAPPELLGLEEARIEAPPVLAFDIDLSEEPPSEPDESTDAVGEAADEDGTVVTDGTSETPAEPETEPEVDAETDGADSQEPAADDADTGDGEETDEEEVPAPVPVPVASAGIEPRYEDPSELIVTAGGRPFDLPEIPDAAEGSPGVTEDTIRIGGLVTESLAGFYHREGACIGAAARFEQANQHEELSRSIEFQGCYDDVGDVGISLGYTNVLLRDEVFAVVPLASDAWFHEDVLTDAAVPYVGADRLPGFCGRGTPYGFGTHGARGCPVLDARGFVTLVQPVISAWLEAHDGPAPDGTVLHLVERGPDGEVVGASRAFEAELLDRPEPVVLPLLPTAADPLPMSWTTTVRDALDVEPAVIFLEGPQVAGLPAAFRDAGFEGELVLVGVIDPRDADDPDFRGQVAPLTVVSPGVDLANRTSPGWTALVAAVAGQGLEEDDIDLDVVDGYLAADFIVRAIAATPEPLSGAALNATVNGGWWYPGVEGLACGSWWPASHFVEVPCVSVAQINLFSTVPVLGLVDTRPQLRFNLADD